MSRYVRNTIRVKVAISEIVARDETAISPLRCNGSNGSIAHDDDGDSGLGCDGSFRCWSSGLGWGVRGGCKGLTKLDMF